MKSKITHIVGIDEAGRGPLAGPVSVGAVCVPAEFDWELLSGVKDSKKLSESKREEIFTQAKKLSKEGIISYKVSMVNARVIDDIGITKSVTRALGRALSGLNLNPENVSVKLDGLLHAPSEYSNQETIVKGDQKEKVIGLASIMAKVTRDRYMVKIGSTPEFSVYNFIQHKGYGTSAHRKAITKNGISTVHRASYCKKI